MEHFKFLEALKMFGKEWQRVQQHVHTRTSTQARSHAQKFFVKLDKKQLTLEEFLERLDIEQLKIDLRLGDAGDSTEYDEDQPLITIANQKNKGSVMNIALPGETFNVQEEAPDTKICHQEDVTDKLVNQIALNNMVLEDDVRNVQNGNKRSSMQRKAKTNHAFFSKNYSDAIMKDSVKRRKTDIDDEVIIHSDCDTKIRIDRYALENLQQEEHIQPEGEDMDDLQQFEHEMRANSELDEILENPEEIMKELLNRDFNYYEYSVLSHQQESIVDLIDSKPREECFKGFIMLPNDSQLDSNVHLISNNNDWKVE